MKVPSKLSESTFGKATLPIVLLCVGLLVGYAVSASRNSSVGQNLETQRADSLADAYEYMSNRAKYKDIELSKPILLYDGTMFTLHNIQAYKLDQTNGSKGRKLAIAFDISLSKDKSKIRQYDQNTKSIKVLTDQKSIDIFYDPQHIITDLFDPNTATNQNSMQWTMQLLEYDLKLVSQYPDKLVPHYVRLAHEDESAKPDLHKIWRDNVEWRMGHGNSELDENVRGWVTYVFMIEDWVDEERIDESYTDNMILTYKNAGVKINNLLYHQAD